MPLARAQELRTAVVEFARVKPAVAYAETFGEGDPGTVAYYLATAFGEIWLQPSGDLGLTGIAAETTFLRGLLDKLGLEPQLAQRHEYKNAVDRIARYDYTDAFREASTRLVAVRVRAGGRRDRGRPRAGRGAGARAGRRRPAVGRPGPRGRPGRPRRLPGRGLRGPRPRRRRAALPVPVRASWRAPEARRPVAQAGRGRRGHRRRRDPAGPQPAQPAQPRRRRRLGHGRGRAARRRPGRRRQGRAAAGRQPRRLVRGLGRDLAGGRPAARATASRWSRRWATSPAPVATSSRWARTRSWPSPAR